MQIWEMKQVILQHYKDASTTWKNRVRFEMPNNQIIAIYYSILERKEKQKKKEAEEKKYHQMTIFEWMEMKDAV